MNDRNGNGAFDPVEEDGPDDDAPLGAEEEAAATAEAMTEADETLDERVESVMEGLDGIERLREGESVTYLRGGRAFAVLMPELLEVALDPAVAKAALRTPDTRASARGAGWIAFTPRVLDRFALDRAEAWLRSARRRVAGG